MMKYKKVNVKHGKGYERDYNSYDWHSERRYHIPSWEEYKQILSEKSDNPRLYYVIRLINELGISPLALVNLKRIHYCTMKPKSIFVEIAKGIKRKKGVQMRSRLLPINDSLYPGLNVYINSHEDKYLIPRKKLSNMPLTVQRICQWYKKEKIPWTPHKGRAFFKDQLKSVLIMQSGIQYDEGEVRKIMGHQPRDSAERYDTLNFELAQAYVNEVFGKRM